MTPPNDPLVKGFAIDEETGERYPIRVMNEAEWKERAALNIANTTSAMRARVLAQQADANGYSRNTPLTIRKRT